MTSHLARIVDAFNANRIDEVVARTTDDYYYSDQTYGRIDGAEAHKALMHEILRRFPQRRMTIFKSWSAPGGEFGEGEWLSGTPTDGGEMVRLHFVTLIELEGDLMRRWSFFRV